MGTDQEIDRRDSTDAQRAAQIGALLESAPLPMIEKSIEAFRRNLPEMLKTRRGEWVAFHGEELVGFARTQTELVQECFRRGLTLDDFVVCTVDEWVFDPESEVEDSPDV
jgi:hypothetical protein